MSGKISDIKVSELLLKLIEIEDPEKSEKQVMIEKAICLKHMCDYVVSCSYGDITLIIAMLRDYVKILDEVKEDDISYQAYYRNRFLSIADRLSCQIDYDYDKAVEKCRKKQEKESRSDVGEEAIALAIKYGGRAKKKKKEEGSKDETARDQETAPGSGEDQ